jgi:regulator of sigma E protease
VLAIISAVVVIAILIFVHELGHFTFAKLFKVKVLAFSLGFGPALLKKKIGETEYRLSVLPLGGYVKMLGENDDEKEEPVPEQDIARSYANQANWKKLLILIAGPLSNWIFAMFLLWIVFMHGVPFLTTTIGDVKQGSPAYSAGIKTGDTIEQINGTKVHEWDAMKKIIVANAGKDMVITILRSGKPFTVQVKPKIETEKNIFGEPVKTPIIGIMPAGDYTVKKSNPFEAVVLSGKESVNISYLVWMSLVKLVEGKIPKKDLGGPILIAQQAAHQAKRGIEALMYFTALIGINFAVLNILPIPVLDGGNVVFTLIEAVIRKPINKKVKLAILQFGVLFIILLTVFVFYNDISRIISSHH